MSTTTKVLQNLPLLNYLESADPTTRKALRPFLNWAWKRGFLQTTCSDDISSKPITEVEAMTWLEDANKGNNDLGLIIIRIYQQATWASLVQLVVRLLGRQLLSGIVSSKRSPHSRIYFSSFTQDKDKSKISAISAPSTQERKRR